MDTGFGRVRPQFGRVADRKTEQIQQSGSLPGVPDGKYVVMTFHTEFEKKKLAMEVVTFLEDEDGVWRAAGYFIK